MGSIIKYVKENKRIITIASFALLGIFLVLMSSSMKKDDGGGGEEVISLTEYKERLESEIESLCTAVSGVGRCRVFITFERGEQSSYKGSTVTETKPPKVLGVTVICEGGESDAVKRELSEMVCALFDIGYNRVAILKLNS